MAKNTPYPTQKRPTFTEQQVLDFHQRGKPGKLEVVPTKSMSSQLDLAMAYSPGVAIPVQKIAEKPSRAYKYTTRANMVGVISNGTAILGLGNLGALASKPVMEGKAVLFKRFADVDAIDLELDTEDVDAFINAVRIMGPSFGGINLEDIKAPDCFVIEERLREEMDIPVFHDDQHGTAIIVAAGLINALEITGKKFEDIKVVVNGAGSAGIACLSLIKALGVRNENAMILDSEGVLYKGRKKKINQWQSAHALNTDARTLEDAMKGADVFLGLSVKDVVTVEMIQSMAKDPIIFAMANPDPEIKPELVYEHRPDAIVATGRSDYPNQVNNVLGFPYIFRGALDVHATTINDEMKIAAAKAIAELAREDVPDDVVSAYGGHRPTFGAHYIIPVPFDPRLIAKIPAAVAKAAMETGVARRNIEDFEAYALQLSGRLDPVASTLQKVVEYVRQNPKRVVFAEGEEEQAIRAASNFVAQGLGEAILVGREDRVKRTADDIGINLDDVTIMNAKLAGKKRNKEYMDYLYERLQRQGYLYRDVVRLIHNDRNHFAATMLAFNDADAMISGLTRNQSVVLDDVTKVIDPRLGHRVIGVSLAITHGQTYIIADTAIHAAPDAETLADIAQEAADVAVRLGYVPRVAMLAHSTFGLPADERSEPVREAVKILEKRKVKFEFDGEMSPDIALDRAMAEAYPFCRLSAPANVLVMPAINSATIATQMLQSLGDVTVLGPIIVGLDKPVQIVPLNAKDTDLFAMAALAAFNIGG